MSNSISIDYQRLNIIHDGIHIIKRPRKRTLKSLIVNELITLHYTAVETRFTSCNLRSFFKITCDSDNKIRHGFYMIRGNLLLTN